MTMIRINLLPVRQVKKRAQGQQFLVLAAAVLLAVVGANFVWYQSRSSEQAKLQQRAATIQSEIRKLEAVIGEVNNLNARKKEVEEKLAVLDQLRKGRSGPVRLMDALATSTPRKVWLAGFEESSDKVKLTGTALSHDDVAEFMRGLSNVVWTPRGMGRLVEQRRDAKTSRVELLTGEGGIHDFPVTEITAFFRNIELKKATQTTTDAEGQRVAFEINFGSTYAI